MTDITVIVNPAPITNVTVNPPITETITISNIGNNASSFGFSITGSNNQSFINVQGQSGIQTILSGNNLLIDGSQIIATIQASNSGNIAYNYTLNSGIDFQYVPFPQNLAYTPILTCVFINNIDNLLYGYAINSVTTSGFNALFSDILVSSGYQLGITLSL